MWLVATGNKSCD